MPTFNEISFHYELIRSKLAIAKSSTLDPPLQSYKNKQHRARSIERRIKVFKAIEAETSCK